MSCKLCGGNHSHKKCPHESQFSQLGKDTSAPNLGFNLQGREIKQPIQRRPCKGQPSLWKPTYLPRKKQDVVKQQLQKNKLTTKKVTKISQE